MVVQHTIKEVARSLGLSMKQVGSLVASGQIRSIVVDGEARIACDAINDFLEDKNPRLPRNHN